jgi:hypothetical protein
MPPAVEFTIKYIYVGASGVAVAVRLASSRALSSPATLPKFVMPYHTYDNIKGCVHKI